MSNFLIFKANFDRFATPAIGTYTVEGGNPQFIQNLTLSPDYYMYVKTAENPVKWFVPTAAVTDFEFVCDILTRDSNAGYAPYFTIADSNGVTRLRMESQYSNIRFMSDDTHGQSSSVICLTHPTDIGGYGKFHQFRIRIRKLTDSSSSVEVYANDNLVTSGTSPALITCGKISFLGATGAFVTGNTMGVKNAYVYDLSGGDVIDRGVLSNAFTRFIGWAKGIFALKSDIPTVNNGTLTIQKNGASVATFTANQSTAATANITVPTAVSELTNDSGYLTSSSNLDASKLTSGTVDIARLPQGALERLVKVANEAARYALTTADVQLGDTVQQLDTGIMYIVTDADHLDSAAGYTEYTAGTAASVPWSGVTGKPTFAAVATSGAYSDLTGTPTIPTVNNATLTIQQNGTTVDTFTANSSSDKTVNISVPTKTSDLTNDSGFLTSADCLPIGSYIQFAGSQAPDGFLVCNGGAVSRTTYSNLFAVIGTTYGSGDDSTTFNLPNLTDRFLQGSTISGTVKDAGLPNITGSTEFHYRYRGGYAIGAFLSEGGGGGVVSEINETSGCSQSEFNASRSNSIYGNSTTVQPPALTCLICIKY